MEGHGPDDPDGSAEESVRVFVRIRPLNKRELAEKQTIGWNFDDTCMYEDTQNGQRVYAYDHCFGPNSTNQETYEIVGKPVVLKAMEGFNGTVFTYGQTGSGKTWTMRGCESDPGMMILCVRDILNWVESHPQHTYTIRVSYLEVYNEEINDLLGDGRNMRIVSEDAARGAVIGGLVEEVVKSSADFMEVLLRGEASRSYASTGMNETSSRSHTIYKVSFEAQDRDSSGSTSRISYLNLVDLAGSERQKSTKAEGKILKEGANINRSLLALGAVINKLGEATKKVKGAKPVFIPYRDSKLTRILKQSLGGNTLTSMLCAVTPAPMHREETVSTLKFGQLCKNIKNMVKGNDGLLDDKALLKQYRTQLNELRSQLEEFAGPASAGLEPEVLIANAMREKNELENKLRTLETAVRSSGADGLDLASLMTFDSSLNGDGAAQYSKLEITKLNEKIAEQQQLISQYRSSLDEFQDLEESKAAFEEYEHHHKQELEEEIAKLENEKVVLQRERAKILKDRSSVDEKESRIGQLITNLDEKESKLRQMMGTMKEQQEQWQRSVSDLQRREDLVDDWQRTHRQREKRLQEIDKAQEDKFKELNSREKTLSEGEQRLKTQERELQEREQRLQVALSRVANSEQALSAQEEKLTAFEAALKKKEGDADIRERELLSRRKEMESWDVLLREKDRKVSIEQRSLDEREAAVHAQEEKARLRDSDAERRLTELRQNEATVASQMDTYTKQLAELDSQALTLKADQKKCAQLQEDLSNKEAELTSWENRLKKLQELMSGINEREADLNKRIEQHKQVEDEFFNVKVAQITSRHTKELGQLEAMVSQQLKIVSNFQKELDSTRADLAQKTNEIAEYEVLVEQRNKLIDQLKEQVKLLGEGNNVTSLDLGEKELKIHGDDVDNFRSAEDGIQKLHIKTDIEGEDEDRVGDHSKARSQNGEKSSRGHAPPYNNSKPTAHGSQDFMVQLAATQQMLYQILEKHDALPDRHGANMRKSFLRLNRRRDSNQPASEEQSKEPVVHYDSGHEHMDESRGPLLRTQSVSNIHPQHSIEYRRHSNPVRGTSEAAVFQHLHGSLNGYKQTLHSGRGSLSSSPAAELPVHSSIVNPLAGGPFVAAMAEEKDGGYSLASGIRSARGSLVFQTPPAMNQGITPATPPPTSVDQALNHNGSDLSTYTRSRASSSVSQTPKPISTPASRISRTPLTKSKSTIGKGSADKLKAAGEKTDSVYSPDISRLVTTSAPRNGIPVATVNLTTVGTSYKKVSNNAHSDR